MKLHYRIINDEVEIVRCFGADPALELPEEIKGRPVKRMAPYAFSARKDREDEDVLVFTTDEDRMFRDEERLLAGEVLESVRLPDTMEEAGRYLFYGCRNLRELHFSDRLKNIGSGAFTGCRSLSALHVRLLDGDRSCVHDILGDLCRGSMLRFIKREEKQGLYFPNITRRLLKIRLRASSLPSITDPGITTDSVFTIRRSITGSTTVCFIRRGRRTMLM